MRQCPRLAERLWRGLFCYRRPGRCLDVRSDRRSPPQRAGARSTALGHAVASRVGRSPPRPGVATVARRESRFQGATVKRGHSASRRSRTGFCDAPSHEFSAQSNEQDLLELSPPTQPAPNAPCVSKPLRGGEGEARVRGGHPRLLQPHQSRMAAQDGGPPHRRPGHSEPRWKVTQGRRDAGGRRRSRARRVAARRSSQSRARGHLLALRPRPRGGECERSCRLFQSFLVRASAPAMVS